MAVLRSAQILEQNVTGNMSKRLEKHVSSIEVITACFEALEIAARAIASGDDFARISEGRKWLFGKPEEPLPVIMLMELKRCHGLSRKEVERWKITKEINRVYDEIVDVASAHVRLSAYEAAMTTLFKLEMETDNI